MGKWGKGFVLAFSKCWLEPARTYKDAFVASIHMPRIGYNVADGKWEDIEPIVYASLANNGVPVSVYVF
jgi:hypothetical protein